MIARWRSAMFASSFIINRQNRPSIVLTNVLSSSLVFVPIIYTPFITITSYYLLTGPDQAFLIMEILDTFWGGFFVKPELNKSFPSFRFDIYFKIHLVQPLGFKVINVRNLHSKNLKGKFKYYNVNIFQLFNFSRIPN